MLMQEESHHQCYSAVKLVGYSMAGLVRRDHWRTSHVNVMRVSSHFLIEFKSHSTR